MPQNYEIVSFNEANPVRCTMQRIGALKPHLHDFFELDFVLTGSCRVTAGEQAYTLGPEDVISFDAHLPHAFAGTDCTLITVQFDQSLFERMLAEPWRPAFLCNSAVQGDSPAFVLLRRLIARLVKNNADRRSGYELRNWALVYDLMDVMYNNFRVSEADARAQRVHRYSERVAEIVRIINEDYREDLTLGELAGRVHLSAPYLSKFFEKQFGITFLAYLTRVRLNHAVGELLRSDDTIETVSANSGFPNSHAFVQAFKKEFGMLPSIYRRREKHRSAAPVEPLSVEQHDYMAGLRKYLVASQQETPAQAVASRASFSAVNALAPLRHTWRNVLAVTSAHAILLGGVQEMLRRIQRDVGFRYIKFNGILSDQMHVYDEDANGEAVYSFAYVDQVFDFLRSVGLRPFVQLSFMPEKLAKTQRRLFGYLVSEPASNEKWCALVSALIRHLQERYGCGEVRTWRFCVWHQPDTPRSMYGFETTEGFYRFYRDTWNAVKRCDPAIPFGSPATFYILEKDYINWYLPFTAWCAENGCMPDFLNFNYYDTTLSAEGGDHGRAAFGFTHAMTLRDTPDGFNDFVTQMRAEHRRVFPNGTEIYLTEWNNTPSQQDLLNDTCFKSCYIAKGILENYDRLDSFAYWSLTDWMGEAPQPKEMFFGGLGLFTANGIPKASYFAFTLLRELGDTLLGKGEGWFATRQGSSYRVLLYNYQHFSHLYALGERFDMTFTDRYTPFSVEQLQSVHLALRDIPDGGYTVTETILNRRSGSAFDTWLSMGAAELQKQAELNNLASRSIPAISKYTATAAGGVLELDALLEMLEVRFVVIEKL